MSQHTLEQDFQHFMAYTNSDRADEAKLRVAYEHGNARGERQTVRMDSPSIERLRYALKLHDENRTTIQSLASSVGDFLREVMLKAGQCQIDIADSMSNCAGACWERMLPNAPTTKAGYAMSHKDTPPETLTQTACREWWQAAQPHITRAWGRAKGGSFLAEESWLMHQAWLAAKETEPTAQPASPEQPAALSDFAHLPDNERTKVEQEVADRVDEMQAEQPAVNAVLYKSACDSAEEWKVRALKAEEVSDRLMAEINDMTGPAFMGEPALPKAAEPTGIPDAALPYESALASLIEAIDSSIESDDILADAHAAAMVALKRREQPAGRQGEAVFTGLNIDGTPRYEMPITRPTVPVCVPDAWPKLELWFFRELSDAQRLSLLKLHGFPVDEIGQSLQWQKDMLRKLLAAAPSAPQEFIEDIQMVQRLALKSGKLNLERMLGRVVLKHLSHLLVAAPQPGESA